MDVPTHIEALRVEGGRMAAATRAADPGAPVPTCPEWALRDLVRHLGGVHRWATRTVAEARPEYAPADLEELAGGWPADADLADWFVAGHAALVSALVEAPADLECWTFLSAPSPRAMWARRQAHETAIHRVDAELSAGLDVHPFAASFAADGVDELLTCFVPRRSTKLRAEPPATLGVRCVDDDRAWLLSIGPEGVSTSPSAGEAACTVRGTAGDLYLALWNRIESERLTVEGDRTVLGAFGDAVQVRWA
jgi:uncharacterized protein (TIGR03083 family)